jgi:hypothetical protein
VDFPYPNLEIAGSKALFFVARIQKALAASDYTEENMARRRKREEDELGPDSAGQSGDIQQLPDAPTADSESVEELTEEGNAFEAGIVQGVENAKDADVSEVTTREVREDDVPEEYLDDERIA